MRYSGVKIEKLTGLPSNPNPNQFYLLEINGIIELYLSSTSSELVLLGTNQLIPGDYEEFSLTSGQTDITLDSAYASESNTQLVYLNGLLESDANYTIVGNTLTLDSPATSGDLIKVVYLG